MVDQPSGLIQGMPADHLDQHLRSPRRPDTARDPGPAGGGRGDRQAAGGAVPDHRPGSLQAPEGARARRTDHPRPLGAASALRLQAAPLAEAVVWLESYRRFWQGSFDRLDERLQASERDSGSRWLMRSPQRRSGNHDHARVRCTSRACAGGSGPRRTASRSGSAARSRRAAFDRLDGRQAGRPVAADRCSPVPGVVRSNGRGSIGRWPNQSGRAHVFLTSRARTSMSS